MKEINLSEGALKSLKVFSYHVKSHGCNEASTIVNLYPYGETWPMKYWLCKDGTNIEGYDFIDNLVEYLIKNSDYEDMLEDSESNSEIKFVIDCDEKNLDVYLSEQVRTSNELNGPSFYIDEIVNKSLTSFFNDIRDNGIDNGRVTFDGGGDSGYIEPNLETNKAHYKVPNDVIDFLYEELENFYAGWEINEGSHGYFIFDFDDRKIHLTFYEHAENMESRGKIFHIKF